MILVGFSIVAPGTVQAASPVVTLAPSSFTFAAQTVGTQSAAQTLTVTNTGTLALQLVSGTFTGTNTSDFSFTTNCPFSLAVGASCTANITFKPSAAGTRTATFLATDNAADSPQSISLSGTGTVTTAPAVSLSASSLTFANQAVNTTSAAQGVTLTNTGTAALTISSIAASAPFSQTNTCPTSPSTLAANGNCTISVKFSPTVAGNQSGSVTISDNAAGSPHQIGLTGTTPASDTTPPTVSMTAPTAGSTLTGTVTVSANASDNVAVASVQFKLDGANIGAAVTTSPYSISWNSTAASNAAHTLTALATDTSGNTTTSAGVGVTVSNTVPVISSFIATPASISNGNSSTLSWTVSGTPAPTLSISGGVGTVTGTTSKVVSPTTTTTYTLTATNSNGTVTSQTTVTVTAETVPPTVSITSPTAGSTVSGTVTLMANASDNVAVAQVQFKLDGANLGAAVTAAPYTMSWDTTPSTNANHTLTAVATDTSNNSTTSSSVSVRVSNPKPTISSFTANPTAINSGSSSTLSWTVTGALTLSINGGVGSVTGTSSISVSPTATTTYTLTATNNGGTSTAQTTINVTPPLTAGAVNVILDDDLADDTDDVGDMALLWQLTKRKESNVLAIIISSTNPYSAPAAAAIATYYNHATTPIGAYQGNTPNSYSSTFSYYTQQVAAQFGNPSQTRTNFPDSTTVYRQALAAAPNGSVYIVAGGFYEPLMALLKSPADSISSKTGSQLVAQKVAALIPAAGWFPSSGNPGTSNFAFDSAAASYVFANWPTAIVSVGNEVGGSTITGPASNASTSTNPIKLAYNLFCSNGQYCPNMVGAWTQAAILYAVRGLNSTFVFGGSNGNTTVDASTGANTWTQSPANQRFYIEKTISDAALANIINPLIQAAP